MDFILISVCEVQGMKIAEKHEMVGLEAEKKDWHSQRECSVKRQEVACKA